MRLAPRERVLRAVRHEPVDCIPAAPFIYDLAAVATGVSLLDYYTQPEAMVRAQLGLQEMIGHDVISVGSDNYYIAEGFGCETTRCIDQLPSLIKPPLMDIGDVFEVDVPDPYQDGRMPVMIEAIRQLRCMVGDEIAIRCPGTGPFALASYLIGTQKWLMEIGMIEAGMEGSNEPAVRNALKLAADALIRFGQACSDAGADIIQCGDSLASCDVISPRTYERFALPYQREVFRAWRRYGVTATLLHICGDSTRVLDLYAQTGADLIEIDNKVDLGHAKKAIGDRVTLIGNVPTVTELFQGTVDTVHEAANRCIQQAGDTGFILGSGCIVPRGTPIENVREMVQTAHCHQCSEE